MNNSKLFAMAFAKVYPCYVDKVEKKGYTVEQLDMIICWLTGYSGEQLKKQIEKEVSFETFFAEALQMNANVGKITGVVCGHRVEDIEDPLMQKIRYMDKLVDELARGKKMENILRK